MEKISKEKVRDYANKLLIDLNEDEVNLIQSEFDVIEANMDLINEIEGIDKVEPAFAPFDLYETDFREDEPLESVPADKLLANTGKKSGREIEVPRVVN